MLTPLTLRANYYQHFDCDFTRDVPTEGFGGWKQAPLTFAAERTAVVVMHAWDCGTREQYPGWHRCAEYIGRASDIVRDVFPPILDAVRRSPLPLYHVVWGAWNRHVYENFPGYQRAQRLAIATPPLPRVQIDDDPFMPAIYDFRNRHVFVGEHNQADVDRGVTAIKFPQGAEPRGDEGVVENADQLLGLCQADGIDHLVYIGFTINGCMLVSAGGMIDMSRRGLMCSVIRQATTAIENKETARHELAKEHGLWFTSLLYGFVFDADDFVRAVEAVSAAAGTGR
jgi:nicotinamidase-related amidase